jgi:hypothetical protein
VRKAKGKAEGKSDGKSPPIPEEARDAAESMEAEGTALQLHHHQGIRVFNVTRPHECTGRLALFGGRPVGRDHSYFAIAKIAASGRVNPATIVAISLIRGMVRYRGSVEMGTTTVSPASTLRTLTNPGTALPSGLRI